MAEGSFANDDKVVVEEGIYCQNIAPSYGLMCMQSIYESESLIMENLKLHLLLQSLTGKLRKTRNL